MVCTMDHFPLLSRTEYLRFLVLVSCQTMCSRPEGSQAMSLAPAMGAAPRKSAGGRTKGGSVNVISSAAVPLRKVCTWNDPPAVGAPTSDAVMSGALPPL